MDLLTIIQPLGSSKEALEGYCGGLMRLINPLIKEDGSGVSQALRDSLNALHGCEPDPSYEEQ